jgi:hypothetical protein
MSPHHWLGLVSGLALGSLPIHYAAGSSPLNIVKILCDLSPESCDVGNVIQEVLRHHTQDRVTVFCDRCSHL